MRAMENVKLSLLPTNFLQSFKSVIVIIKSRNDLSGKVRFFFYYSNLGVYVSWMFLSNSLQSGHQYYLKVIPKLLDLPV